MSTTDESEIWPVRTSRLEIRRGTEADLETIWKWRRLPEVNRWLTSAPSTFEEFRERYAEPERLATTLIIELLSERSGEPPRPIGDVMLRREDVPRALDAFRDAGYDVEVPFPHWVA